MYAAVQAQEDLEINVDAAYNFYGVYPATPAQLGVYGTGTDHADKTPGFHMVFASLLKHSTMKTVDAVLKTAPGTHGVYISNDDLNLTTPLGGKFFLFDGLDADQMVAKRATLNALSFNEAQRPFSTVEELTNGTCTWTAKSTLGEGNTSYDVDTKDVTNAERIQYTWNIDTYTGEVSVKGIDASADPNKVIVSAVKAYDKRPANSTDPTEANVVGGVKGGLYIQLPTSVEDGQQVTVTVTLKDKLGYEKKVNFVIQKIG